LCYALYLSGYQIWASDKLTFYHFIPASRMTKDYMMKNIMGIAHSTFILSVYKLLIANKERARPAYKSWWFWMIMLSGVSVGKKLLSKFKRTKTDELSKTEDKAELYLFSLFLKNRTSFYTLFTSLSNSKWIIKN
jgi:hypothetical protein